MPVWIFSQTRGTPKNRVGRTSPSAPTSWAGSPMRCTWAPSTMRDVDAEHPLGDVRVGQVGDADVLRAVEAGGAVAALDLEEHVVVGDHHALGVPGGARGVEDRRRLVGVDAPASAGRPRLRAARASARPRSSSSSQVSAPVGASLRARSRRACSIPPVASASAQRATWSAVSSTTTRGLGVPGDVGDLAGGERVVDRHRGGAGVHRADVGEHVLDPVGGHDRDPVAGLHTEVDEGGGEVEARSRAARATTACASPAPSMPILSENAGLLALLGDGVGERVRDAPALR